MQDEEKVRQYMQRHTLKECDDETLYYLVAEIVRQT
jgi:hypothetical protein